MIDLGIKLIWNFPEVIAKIRCYENWIHEAMCKFDGIILVMDEGCRMNGV